MKGKGPWAGGWGEIMFSILDILRGGWWWLTGVYL